MNVVLTLLFYTVRMSTPLLFVIMGGVFVQRAGVFNFALESAINTGAFAAIAAIMLTGKLWVGVITALIACVLVNMFFALFTVKFSAHPTVVGMAINLLTAAIIPYLMMALFDTSAVINVTSTVDPGRMMLDVPVLRNIPILGDIFNLQTPLTYLSFLMIAVLMVVYYKTTFGTHVRLVGDNWEAAEAIGINVQKVKIAALVISGLCCALAGLNISVESLGMYTLNISASRGYICLSAINCGRKEPGKSALFGLLFGFTKAVQIVLSDYLGSTLASLLEALPYITIIVVLVATELPAVRRNPMRIFMKG